MWGRSLGLSGLIFLLSGCEADYYLHLIQGQARILLQSQSIGELLESAQVVDEETRQKLALVESIRSFAREHIGLEPGDNYTYFYDTGGRPVSWNVSACPPHRFSAYKWSFPIVGAVPYKGFFEKNRALEERERLQKMGYDTIVRPVSAYSTLGFFSDPVLSPMLNYSEDRLANLLIHELTHSTIYIADHADFNESLATFVGRQGALDFIVARHGTATVKLSQIRKRREESARFRKFLQTLTTSLDSLYSQDLERQVVLEKRIRIFERAQDRYRELRSTFTAGNFDYFLDWQVNNAQLLSFRRYNRDLELFSRVYDSEGQSLDRVLAICQSCADASDPWSCLRQTLPATSPL